MARIEKLTPEQAADLPIFRQKWLDIGLSTEPANFAAGTEVIGDFYQRIGKPRPMFLCFSSPMMCALAYGAIKGLLKGKAPKRAQLGGQLRDQLGGQLRDQLGGQLVGQLRGQLGDQLVGQLVGQLVDQLGDQLHDQLRGQLVGQLRGQLGDQLGGQLRGQLRGQLGDQLGDQNLFNEVFGVYYDYWNFGGQHAAYWIAYYTFAAKIGVNYGPDNLRLLEMWAKLAESVCWWQPFDGLCLIGDRPRKVSFDAERRLHCETGPAVAFSDGWGVHAWHGQRIPAEWIEDKPSLTAKTALAWTNVEQRRAACEILGWANVLEDPSLNPKVINTDEPHIGTLMQVDLPDAPQQWFLKYRCGTGRWFAESVNDKRFDTALKANAGGNGWRPGMGDPQQFIPFVRT